MISFELLMEAKVSYIDLNTLIKFADFNFV